MKLQESEDCPGTIGPLLDELPLLSSAIIRPYVVAIILHRGAVRPSEICAALTPHCAIVDLQVGAWSDLEYDYLEGTRLEYIVDQVLGEFVSEGHLRYNEENHIWVAPPTALKFWMSKATELDAALPRHLTTQVF
jgi:hypothetical protein